MLPPKILWYCANRLVAQADRLLARIKTLVGRGMRAFYLDSMIAPGRLHAVLRMRRAFPQFGPSARMPNTRGVSSFND